MLIYIYIYVCILIRVLFWTYIYTYTRSVVQYWWSCTPSRSIGLFFFLGNELFLGWMTLFVFFGLPIVPCSLIRNLISVCLWPLVFVLNNILTLSIWRSAICHLPECFAPWTFFQNIGPLYVTSSYSTLIFYRGVSGFPNDSPCGVWYRGLTTCLLHVGPPFGNQLLNNSSV